MRLYIAGPMTGLPEFNYPAFIKAEERLRHAGFSPESPHHNGAGEIHDWSWYMRAGIRQLLRCEGVALLPGSEASKGAQLETHIATSLGMEVRTLDEWLARGSRSPVGSRGGAR